MRIIVYAEPIGIERKDVREALSKAGIEAGHIILRTDYDHIEIDLEVDADPKSILTVLKGIGVRPQGISVIEEDGDDADIDPIQTFLEYFARGWFWEIHEKLEKIWRRSGDPFLRGLILATIPYVKQQMRQYDKVWEAIERLERYAAERGDERLTCLAKEMKKGYRDGRLSRIDPRRCLSRP